MILNAHPGFLTVGGDRQPALRLQVLTADWTKPADPDVDTLYIPCWLASQPKIVFAEKEPDAQENLIWVKASLSSGKNLISCPFVYNGNTNYIDLYIDAVSEYDDGQWWLLEEAALYRLKTKSWVSL